MDSQISLQNMNYFSQLEQRVDTIRNQLAHMSAFSKERAKKYQSSLKFYQTYIRKQTEALKNNQRHSDPRNKFFLQQTKKSWKNAITNRPIVLRSMARTNVMKKDTNQWIGNMDDHIMINGSGQEESRINGDSEEVLLRKYNQILREYHMK